VTHPVLSPRREPVPRDYLPDVVGASGGLVYNVPAPDFLSAAVLAFVGGLRSQYLLAYETTKPLDGRYRRIQVQGRRRDLSVRHRGGYLAVPPMRR
jgi:hypothetical protein